MVSSYDGQKDELGAARMELTALGRHAAECEERWQVAYKENRVYKEQMATGSAKLDELRSQLAAMTADRDNLSQLVDELKEQIAQLLARMPKVYQKPRFGSFI